MRFYQVLIGIALVSAAVLFGCDQATLVAVSGMDSGVVDTETNSEVGTDTNSDTGIDINTDISTDDGIIDMDCSECEQVGSTLDHLACAIDLCDEDVVLSNTYTSPEPLIGDTDPSAGCTLEDTYEAVTHFGNPSNDLVPKLNGSYVIMATGIAEPSDNSTQCWPYDTVTNHPDPFSSDLCPDGMGSHMSCPTWDVMNWTLQLKAPIDARSFRFKYVFFSAEYDEYISATYNDKFYVIIEAQSTKAGVPTVINFTQCRDPSVFSDFTCGDEDYNCVVGDSYCYVAVNSALSECCWYPNESFYAPNPDDPPCPGGQGLTDITGTGFGCAVSAAADSASSGSSTGWLRTVWPVDGGEIFTLTFRIHDSIDSAFDSEVIIDSFEFLTTTDHGTHVVIE